MGQTDSYANCIKGFLPKSNSRMNSVTTFTYGQLQSNWPDEQLFSPEEDNSISMIILLRLLFFLSNNPFSLCNWIIAKSRKKLMINRDWLIDGRSDLCTASYSSWSHVAKSHLSMHLVYFIFKKLTLLTIIKVISSLLNEG